MSDQPLIPSGTVANKGVFSQVHPAITLTPNQFSAVIWLLGVGTVLITEVGKFELSAREQAVALGAVVTFVAFAESVQRNFYGLLNNKSLNFMTALSWGAFIACARGKARGDLDHAQDTVMYIAIGITALMAAVQGCEAYNQHLYEKNIAVNVVSKVYGVGDELNLRFIAYLRNNQIDSKGSLESNLPNLVGKRGLNGDIISDVVEKMEWVDPGQECDL